MTKNRDSAIFCLLMSGRMHGRHLSYEQLYHNFFKENRKYDGSYLCKTIKNIKLNVKIINTKLDKIKNSVFPLIAETGAGEFFLILKRDQEESHKYLVQKYGDNRATSVTIQENSDLLAKFISVRAAEKQTREDNAFGFSWFFKASMKYWHVLRECILASIFVQIFGLLSPLAFMIVIDKVLSNNSMSTLDVLVFSLIIISIFEILLNALRTYLLSHTANRIDLALGIRTFRHLLNLLLGYFQSRPVGDTIARMKELEVVRQFITGSGILLFLDLLFLVIFLLCMFFISRFLCVIVIAAMPFLFLASMLITPMLRNKLDDRYVLSARNQSFLVELLSGIETVKANGAEPLMRAKWENRLAEQVRAGFAGSNLANLINQCSATVNKVLTVLLLWFGAREVMQGHLTVGQLIAFNMLSSRAVAPILRLSQIWKEFQQVKVSIARIADIFKAPAEPGFNPEKVDLPPIRGALEFDHVTFRYRPDGPVILDDISFSVQPGELVGIIGSTGSGKTTLMKLLQRMYVPEKGRVLVDGIDIALVDAAWLRRQLGVVIQDGVLFNASIRDNISFGNPGLSMEAIVEAAQLAGAHDFIMELQNGYDTVAGERGLRLSTGQRQRLAIARALSANPRMLILDEATSSLDYESEQRIQANMQKICAGRTVFMIAHRLSTIRHADRILCIEKGRIVEDDAPDRLLARESRYAQLHRIQAGA